MAEVKITVRDASCYFRFDDGTGSPLTVTPDHVVDGTLKWTPQRAREATTVLTQSAGESILYDALIKLSGPGKLKFQLLYRDPLNVTDKTTYNLLVDLFNNSFASAAWSAAVSTNPMPGTHRKCVDAVITLKNAKTASTDFVGTVACSTVSIGELTNVNGALAYDVEMDFYEAISWA